MNLPEITAACGEKNLTVLGAFHPSESDNAPEDCKTIVMLGPKEPGFWQALKSSEAFAGPDPVDIWSTETVGGLAKRLGARALFPFGGPPYQPFIAWAFRTGRIWPSPVSLMVHDEAGLFLSFRGALAFPQKIDLPAPDARSPCETCEDKPCKIACPTAALSSNGYDVEACHKWLGQKSGSDCMSAGCLARRACPISQNYGRLAEQSAHHMRAFHRGKT